jgi:hypothetical protein
VVQSQAFTDIISMQLIFDCAPKQRNLLQHLTLLINLTGALAIRSEQFQGILEHSRRDYAKQGHVAKILEWPLWI